MSEELLQSLRMLYCARWNVPKAAVNAGLTNLEMELVFTGEITTPDGVFSPPSWAST